VRINKHYFDRYSLLVLSGRPVNTGIGNIWQVYHHHWRPLNLAISPWVLAMVSATTGEETANSA